MKNQIKKRISEEVYQILRDADNAVWRLPNDYDITYELNKGCTLELRKHEESGRTKTIEDVYFKPLSKGSWASVKEIERFVNILLVKAEFDEEETKQWLIDF